MGICGIHGAQANAQNILDQILSLPIDGVVTGFLLGTRSVSLPVLTFIHLDDAKDTLTLAPPSIDAYTSLHSPHMVPPLLRHIKNITWVQLTFNCKRQIY